MEELKIKYYHKLKILNETIWDRKTSKVKIDAWLGNFENNIEKTFALYLLTQFIYFDSFLVKSLLISAYRDLYKYKQIEKIRKENDNTLDATFINKTFDTVLLRTRFVILGNPAESSAHLMYNFRTENSIPTELFISEADIGRYVEEVDHFVFIDDLCGSGSQAIDYSSELIPLIEEHFPEATTSYFPLIATKDGKKNVRDYANFTVVDSILELDNSYKCFEEDSRIFINCDNKIDIVRTQELCGKYGTQLMKVLVKKQNPEIEEDRLNSNAESSKFGFDNGQLLIGFNHNTPDNTLPIFWFSENIYDWTPIFKRHNKVYKIK